MYLLVHSIINLNSITKSAAVFLEESTLYIFVLIYKLSMFSNHSHDRVHSLCDETLVKLYDIVQLTPIVLTQNNTST